MRLAARRWALNRACGWPWESEDRHRMAPVVELRQYTLHPRRRDERSETRSSRWRPSAIRTRGCMTCRSRRAPLLPAAARSSTRRTPRRTRWPEPERAGEERALAALQSVLRRVSPDEQAVTELAIDRIERSRHACAVGFGVSEQRREEQARVEVFRIGRADVAPQPVRPAAFLHEAPDRVAFPGPPGNVIPRDAGRLGEGDRAIEGDPAHHLGLCEVTRCAPHSQMPESGSDQISATRSAIPASRAATSRSTRFPSFA